MGMVFSRSCNFLMDCLAIYLRARCLFDLVHCSAHENLVSATPLSLVDGSRSFVIFRSLVTDWFAGLRPV